MKCIRCGKEMRNTIGGNYVCDDCGCAVNDLVYREYKIATPSNIIYPGSGDNPNYSFDAPRGWICPKCGIVLSPSTMSCPFCASGNNTTITTDKTTYTVDYVHHDSTTGTTYIVNSTPGASITINKENKKYE